MQNQSIHIVSFNIPFPANYGGVIDVFYKIKSLHQEGIKIILHAFEYGRAKAPELEKYCTEVYYYKRPVSIPKQISTLPFIVKTRDANELLSNLLKDDFPILFEGLHTCYFLDHPKLKDRKKYIRMHNIEWQYYAHLAKVEKSFLKKNYFKVESRKLKAFESVVENTDALLCISKNDLDYFGKKYPSIPSHYIPAFHPNENVTGQEGSGSYVLFHGDLSVKDNEEAALYLLSEVVQGVDCQWIISGLNPSEQLSLAIDKNDKVELKANASHEEMENLIKNAHVNILLSFHSAGMKLKLLNALFKGRFCVVNDFMIDNTGLEDLCIIGNKTMELQNALNSVLEKEFSSNEIIKRKDRLEKYFSNEKWGNEILDILEFRHA